MLWRLQDQSEVEEDAEEASLRRAEQELVKRKFDELDVDGSGSLEIRQVKEQDDDDGVCEIGHRQMFELFSSDVFRWFGAAKSPALWDHGPFLFAYKNPNTRFEGR